MSKPKISYTNYSTIIINNLKLLKLYKTKKSFKDFYNNYIDNYVSPNIRKIDDPETYIINNKKAYYEHTDEHKSYDLSTTVLLYNKKPIGITNVLKINPESDNYKWSIFKKLPKKYKNHSHPYFYLFGTFIDENHRGKKLNDWMFNKIKKDIKYIQKSYNKKFKSIGGFICMIKETNIPSIKSYTKMGFKKRTDLKTKDTYKNYSWYVYDCN